MPKPLYITSRMDWTPELLKQAYNECAIIAKEELELDTYPNTIEVISAEQMLDAYASIGLPVHYGHWSFGKEFMRNSKAYHSGRQGLALEIVINTEPCIAYLMEENDLVSQTMVIAHASFGHNAVFKNNVCFKQWTNAGSIIDYMVFARDYISQCEQRYGPEQVEKVLDAAHALAAHGVDKFKRKHTPKLSEEERLKKLLEDEDREQQELDVVLKRTTIDEPAPIVDAVSAPEDEENLLHYVIERSPNLAQWKREVARIVSRVHTYLYPQAQTKNLNEGMATFVHFYIMTRLEEKGMLSPDAYMSFLHLHSSVINQPNYDHRYYGGINPYALGFAICKDIKRICTEPTDEDREWFPQLIGRRWQDALKEAVFEHRDDSFVAQYLSPKVIRDLRLFTVGIKRLSGERSESIVTEIHDDAGYRALRTILAQSLERISRVPQIKVVGADLDRDRKLRLKYVSYKGRKLELDDAQAVTDHLNFLWGYEVELDDCEE